MNVKLRVVLTIGMLLVSGLALGQDQSQPIPQGSSLPGVSSLPVIMNGPGFLEIGGSYFSLTNSQNWDDVYANALISSGRNSLSGQVSRQERFGDRGWYYGFGWTHVWSENWYSELDFGSSTEGGFFLPKVRTDALISRKLLAKKQLVLQVGGGYDLSKTVNSDFRVLIGGIYYFQRPWIVQGGVNWTHANPGDILARSQFIAVTRGRTKEHYLIFRAGFGREGYEVVDVGQSVVNFAFQDYSLTWRQWIGANWGFNTSVEHEQKPFYHRDGGTFGLFLDF